VSGVRRREFVILLGGSAAAAWPVAVRGQQPGTAGARLRIAFLALGPQQSVHLAFIDGLRRLGYAQGRNLDIDHRYGDVEQLKPLAQELIALKPDILVADVADRLPHAHRCGDPRSLRKLCAAGRQRDRDGAERGGRDR